ncbi:MAG: hypothetical protein HN457_19350 [Opitutales bacterium]|nr:hypothetical protein [Opitutales bacterium]MBT5170208.1 hypothetical protein [Opitutales bacterium]MBT5814599.1 hypothetical protein [Opitutales bacterium]MBT6380079.1 hypothetical protein [Opitutales bacterium]
MPPIITLTANIVAETTYYVPECGPGKTSRAIEERFQVGGKGINVSKMLQRLKAETTTLCFPGGDFGSICERWLTDQKRFFKSFPSGCITRSGTIIRTPDGKEISILGIDSHVSTESVQDCVEYLKNLHEPYVLAICGVFQKWENSNWAALRNWLPNRGEHVHLAVDAYGPSLPWFARQKPNVIKINRQELEMLFDEDVKASATDVLMKRVADNYNCPLWIVTDGEAKIWILKSGSYPQATQPPLVECTSPIGCGDVFFATLLDQQYNHPENSLEFAIELAAKYASKNAVSSEIAAFNLEHTN